MPRFVLDVLKFKHKDTGMMSFVVVLVSLLLTLNKICTTFRLLFDVFNYHNFQQVTFYFKKVSIPDIGPTKWCHMKYPFSALKGA